ncbi:MAG: corrinoid protein [Caldiserica bacterium]|jgi:trimethylamine corrinoid protein|nr:corrinoid protein [Caldisericota bacterium]
MESEIFEKAYKAILEYDAEKAESVAREGIEAGIPPAKILDQGFSPAIKELGDKFENMEIFLPELVMAANAMKAAVNVLESALKKTGETLPSKGTVVLGTVEGDIHDIGKTIVGATLSAAGYKVHDLGVDVPVPRFLEAAEETGAQVIAASALLSTTMLRQRDLVDFLKNRGKRERFIVIVGGAPVTKDWASQIGADAYARDAVEAVKVLDSLITK